MHFDVFLVPVQEEVLFVPAQFEEADLQLAGHRGRLVCPFRSRVDLADKIALVDKKPGNGQHADNAHQGDQRDAVGNAEREQVHGRAFEAASGDHDGTGHGIWREMNAAMPEAGGGSTSCLPCGVRPGPRRQQEAQ